MSPSLFYVDCCQELRRCHLGWEQIGDAHHSRGVSPIFCFQRWSCHLYINAPFAALCSSVPTDSLFSAPMLRREEKKRDFDVLTVRTTGCCAHLACDDRCPRNGFRNILVTCQPRFIIYNLKHCHGHMEHAIFCVFVWQRSYATCSFSPLIATRTSKMLTFNPVSQSALLCCTGLLP